MKSTANKNGRALESLFARGALSRRTFLGGTVAGAAGLASVSLAAPLARAGRAQDAIISIYLRGGLDGLCAVVPYGDPHYASERGGLALAPPGPSPDAAIDLDGFFGLNPRGAALMRPYGDGKLAFVHASGLEVTNRSHFDAQRRMESATPTAQAFPSGTGWLGRHLAATTGPSELRAIAIDNLLPVTLVGAPGTLPVSDIGAYAFPGRAMTRASRRAVIEDLYSNGTGLLSTTAASTFDAIDLFDVVDYASYVEAPGAVYPAGNFGSALRQVAALLKSGIGLEAAQVNLGGWDHHSGLGPTDGQFAELFAELSQGLDAFYADLAGSTVGYVLLAQTEFGRRVRPNGSAGTDHGFASCLFVMGPSVLGGRVVADWPGMRPPTTNDPGDQVNGDLAVTIDWRDVAAEILEVRAGGSDLAAVFPGYAPVPRGLF
jgi:uncharacterized protein (DUF1501 family)